MPSTPFHPAIDRWFSDTLGEPTAAQKKGWDSIRQGRHTLIAAPTGSGKTLAAFLGALNELLEEGMRTPLPDEVRVVYVSPLKALSADIHRNLAEPRIGIRKAVEAMGLHPPKFTAAVRTGDTTQSERASMLRTPPHILVTTPESLYLLLTSERSREMLRTARTVIVDEIHAVIGTRRGAHLALTLERLEKITSAPLLRIGLSATQTPIEEVANYLIGNGSASQADSGCNIVDEGHRRAMDLGVEMPGSPLEAVMSHEIWEDYYDRLTALIEAHRTTLVFVNTRKMAERVARHLSERLGEEAVTSHHGSLSKDKRLAAEHRLKSGGLKALVATASLELGIDIGHVDLVCQIGSPHKISTFLQRVGRSGHTVAGLPKGRIFPVSRDDLVECAALLRCVRRGELDRIVVHDEPLDVLAQQIVAEASCEEYAEEELFHLVRTAWPYRGLAREKFDSVLSMASDGFATRRGRRGALVHRDEVNSVVRGRRGSRMLAITSGGAIPEVADYRVLLEPEETFIGTLNEDFAIESNAGDIFQLGNSSWQVLQVSSGVVRVADAKGAPPSIPFWLGEAPARSDELSFAVSSLRSDFEAMLENSGEVSEQEAVAWLARECGISENAAQEIAAYLTAGIRALGTLPTQKTLILERFFDESGGMQLVLHAPFGSRINKAWGLALRKKFCRQFNFELQAAATEDAILLSLGPQHSFPLADVFRYLHPMTTRESLIQAFLVAPVFQTRWRWNTTISLAIPSNRQGKKIPPQLQRSMADDLMAAVFPDAAACPENLGGDRELPDHPLVNQAVRDCLEEAMDFDGLCEVLEQIHGDELRLLACDTPEPSPLSHDILNARPYSFLDDAPLEERRTQAIYTRRATEINSANDLGGLDPAAIERVRGEERPDPRDADELHDALLSAGYFTDEEANSIAPALFDTLASSRRACAVRIPQSEPLSSSKHLRVAAERLPEIVAVHPSAEIPGGITAPASRLTRTWSRQEALVELVRGRLTITGPATASALAHSLGTGDAEISQALVTLESEGIVLRGIFTAARTGSELEWCDRRLLARIHRYTLNRLRAEIEPVSAADFMRFLFEWHHVTPRAHLSGLDGLQAAIARLDGFEAAAKSWEQHLLPARMDRYDTSMLDMLCLTGEVGWARLSQPASNALPVGATPIALFLREHADAWQAMRGDQQPAEDALSSEASAVLAALQSRGASFSRELGAICGLNAGDLQRAIGELVASGRIASDGFAGLRGLIASAHRTSKANLAGRWSALIHDSSVEREAAIETQAHVLLKRYGVVFRRLLERETHAATWRELTRVYRRLEARGEIRGGRFVSGMSGEQFALPEAVARLREVRREGATGQLLVISAADPLNLAGILTAGDRIRAIASTRIAWRDGVAVSVMEGDYLRPLAETESESAMEAAVALAGRNVPVASGFVGRAPLSR